MNLTVTRQPNDDRSTSAKQINYDNELKGPARATTPHASDVSRKSPTIPGQQVLVIANTTIDDDGGPTVETIKLSDVREISS